MAVLLSQSFESQDYRCGLQCLPRHDFSVLSNHNTGIRYTIHQEKKMDGFAFLYFIFTQLFHIPGSWLEKIYVLNPNPHQSKTFRFQVILTAFDVTKGQSVGLNEHRKGSSDRDQGWIIQHSLFPHSKFLFWFLRLGLSIALGILYSLQISQRPQTQILLPLSPECGVKAVCRYVWLHSFLNASRSVEAEACGHPHIPDCQGFCFQNHRGGHQVSVKLSFLFTSVAKPLSEWGAPEQHCADCGGSNCQV